MLQSHIAETRLAPDLVEHEFHADAPDRPWAADIPPLPLEEFLRKVRKEDPFPVDPGVEDPERLYRWEAGPGLEGVCVAARTNHIRNVAGLIAE